MAHGDGGADRVLRAGVRLADRRGLAALSMRSLAQALPTTWAMEAFNDLMIRGRRADAAYAPTAVLLGFGAAYLALGLALFHRRLSKA